MEFFRDLGSLLEQRWGNENYNEEAFPEIAEQALVELDPHSQVDPWEIIRWVNLTPQLPEQQDVHGMFGNPPITLFNGSRFYIDVYYWLDGTTSIHQHAFCGAFQLLLGSSIHSQYSFEEKQRINAHLSTGRIALKSVELLEKGDVRRILAGRPYIHSLFHLDRPSATITVRTRFSPAGSPQFDYQKPYFAVDPFYKSVATIKKVQSANLLLAMKHPAADEFMSELLSCADFHTAFAMIETAFYQLTNDRLEKAFGLSTGQQRFNALLEVARRRHGELIDLILPVIEERQRQENIVQRRGQITSSEHRFLLALLLNVPDRGRMLDLIRQRYPQQDPVELVIEWIEELAATRMVESPESNVLGIGDFDDEYLFVLRGLLEGLSLGQIKAAAAEEYDAEYTADLASKLEGHYDAIQRSMVFKSIFLDSPTEGRYRVAEVGSGPIR